MNDVLICCYEEGLLRKRKLTQIRTTVSNKKREQERLFIALRKIRGVQKFVDILKPELFKNIVSAAKL